MNQDLWRWTVGLVLILPTLACTIFRQAPMPAPTIEQLVFDIETATPTVLFLQDVPTDVPPTPTVTPALLLTPTLTITPTGSPATATPAPPPTAPPPSPLPDVPLAEPLQGGAWDFEDGFTEWANPYQDRCPGSGLANGWLAFTTRDEFGSSCMNQTVWKDNVYTGESAQEITFAYVGNQAGIYKQAPTIPGHRYTVSAQARPEFSPAPVEVSLGLDLTGGTDWQAETVQWFPWDETGQDTWLETEETVTATGEFVTVFIKGSYPLPEPGGALRLDSVRVVDIGPE